MAKPNFQFEKRQKEIAKKKKNEEKLKRKLEKTSPPPATNPDQAELAPTPATLTPSLP